MMAVQIDVRQIPSSDVHNLSNTFLTAVKNFYDDPENVKRFEEWKIKSNQNKEAKLC